MSLTQTITAGVLSLGIVGGVVAPKLFPDTELDARPICRDLRMADGERDGMPVLVLSFSCDAQPEPVTLIVPGAMPESVPVAPPPTDADEAQFSPAVPVAYPTAGDSVPP